MALVVMSLCVLTEIEMTMASLSDDQLLIIQMPDVEAVWQSVQRLFEQRAALLNHILLPPQLLFGELCFFTSWATP